MKDNNDVDESSARESGYEKFDWILDKNFSKKLKKCYTEYSLKSWKNIMFNPKEIEIRDEGLFYQGVVNKILRKDIFIDFDFHEDKNGAIDFNFKKTYKIDYSKLYKKKISPDFYVYKIESKKFFELLKTRDYMMILKNANEIPKTAKFISILGEIKSSYAYCHINDGQRHDYETFIDLVNKLNTDEYIVLMYIYDNSFNFFQKNYFYNYPEKKNPTIYGYIPKLYYEDCYKSYNFLIDELKLKKEKIDIDDKTSFKKKRRDFEKEISLLTKKINSLQKNPVKDNSLTTQENNSIKENLEKQVALLTQENNSLKTQNKITSCLFIIVVLIFAYLLNKFKIINFNNN